MTTTKNEIREWLLAAKEKKATHVIVVCDTFEYEDYPVNVMPGQDVNEIFEQYNGENMQRVMEVYDLSLDTELQLAEHRAFHF